MSKSFIGFFSEISSADSDVLTRSVTAVRQLGAAEASVSGFIDENPRHWGIEAFIPIEPRDLVEYLVRRSDSAGMDIAAFHAVVAQIRVSLSEQTIDFDQRFDELYHTLDPDQDSRRPVGLEPVLVDDCETHASQSGDPTVDELRSDSTTAVGKIAATLDLCREILVQAGYREVTQEEIEGCVGVASQWGVPLHVDFQMFKQLVIYCRGDIIGNRVCRRLRTFYRIETVEVAVYQRMVVMFQLCHDIPGDEELLARALHLRMFKNIPKQDIDMLLPCTKVKFTWIDRLKIVVPSIGGVLMSARKIINTILIIAVLTLKSTFVLVGLVFAVVGYIVRSVLGYFQTKNRYLLNLTRNLYFQKLDTNAGVGYQVIHQSYEQAMTETVLAYYALLTADASMSERKWRRRCERIVREAIDLEVEIDIKRVSARLLDLGLITNDCKSETWSSLVSPTSNQLGQ